MTVVVVGHSQGGKPILQAEGQLLRIEQTVDLPLGTALQAMLASGASAMARPLDPGAEQDPAAPLTKLIALLDAIDRAGRQPAEPDGPGLARRLPLPDKHLASRFLWLMADVGDHQAEGPLPASAEQRGTTAAQREQIQALVRDLGSAASEPLAEGWKSLTLPLGLDQAQAVTFYVRDPVLAADHEAAGEDSEQTEARRAVFDVAFSRLGRCQIDTLCQGRRFDLLMRSESALPEDDREAITSLFTSACEMSGMHGDIAFRIGSFFEAARAPMAAQDLKA